MAQKALPSTTLAAAVRAYLGLTQEQLASLLGISRGQIAHVEAGRRQLGTEAAGWLRQLARLLPPPLGSAPPPPNQQTVSPTPAVLRRRRAWCVRQVANLRLTVARLVAADALGHRWEVMLSELSRASATTPSPDSTLTKRLCTERLAAPPAASAATATAHTLLTLNIELLEYEITALTALLANSNHGPELESQEIVA